MAQTREIKVRIDGDAARLARQMKWVRLFNRLEAATRRHIEAKEASAFFADEADDELHAAYRSVIKDAAKP